MSRIDVNILIGAVSEQDKICFFGDDEGIIPVGEIFLERDLSTRFPELLADLGLFPSRGQARKNGWDKDIPEGWTDLTIGKLKNRVCILKRTEEWRDGSLCDEDS
jgi:hypothetical protein